MLRDDIVTQAIAKLGDRGDQQANIILEMQLGQEMRLEQNGRFQPWFMVTELSTISTTAHEARVALPSNFVNEVDEGGLWILDSTTSQWVPLTKGDDSYLQSLMLGEDMPTGYSVMGDHIRLFPTPNIVYTLRMRYAAKQTALTTNIENNWTKFAADLVLYDTCKHIASENLQNAGLAQVFDAAKDKAWDRLYVLHEARQHTNREYTMGGN